jgi:hypothetical protein
MNEHPIIMTGESVRAILDGRKTQTRRVIKDAPPYPFTIVHVHDEDWGFRRTSGLTDHYFKCPYGKVGDRLWVREAFRYARIGLGCGGSATCVEYKISNGKINFKNKAGKYPKLKSNKDKQGQHARWRSPIFMPKWAARIWLEITNIRAERLRDISLEDIAAEGIADLGGGAQAVIDCFINEVWDPINEKRGYGWNENPFVWVIEFKRISDKGR